MLAPLLLGLAGSLHCVAMCGALMLSLPLDGHGRRRLALQLTVYHSGRITSYALLGVLFGLLGQGIALAGLQQVLSIVAGAFMIAIAFIAWRFEQLVTNLPGFGRFTEALKYRMGQLMRRSGLRANFTLGMLNGLLPCGMVYAALAGAIASVSGAQGGLFMAVFGLGTLPLLYAFTFAGRSFGHGLKRYFGYWQPVLLTIAGLLLIQRGMALDISLFESAVPKSGFDCH